MLMAVAEGHLDEEDFEEALNSASDALTVFREVKDLVGIADAQRSVVHAYRGKALDLRIDEGSDVALDSLGLAEQTAKEELQVFQDVGDKRGEASMLLSVAEIAHHQQGMSKRQEAVDCAEDALTLFGEVKDAKLEAMACLVASQARLKLKQVTAAKRFGNDAITIFKELADKKNEAIAWGNLGQIMAEDFCYDEAIRCARKQLKLAQEVGGKRLQAHAHHFMASWALSKGDTNASLTSAKSSLELFRDVGQSHGWEVLSMSLLADVLMTQNNPKKAIELVSEYLEKFRERGDSISTARALHHLALAQQADNSFEEALESAREALAAARDVSLYMAEYLVHETLAYLHVDMNNPAEAKQAAAEAVATVRQLGVPELEAKANMFVLARILVTTDDYAESLKACDEALRIARETEDRALEGQALLATCAAQAMNRNHDKALKAGELAADLFREVGGNYRIDEAKTWQIIGELHLAAGEISQALTTMQKGEALLKDFGDKRKLAKMKHSRVKVLMVAGDRQEAVKVALEALKVSRAEDDARGTVQSLFTLIEATVEMLSEGDGSDDNPKPRRVFKQGCEKAIRYAKEAVSLSIKLGARSSEASAWERVAHLQIMIGLMQEARQAAETALEIFKELNSKSGQASALSLVAQCDQHKGDKASALKVLAEAKTLAQEAKDEQLISMLADLQKEISGASAAGPAATPASPTDLPVQAVAAAPAASSESALAEYQAPDPVMVKDYIMSLVANMTGSSDEVDGDTPLMESGIDSLASVELRTQLQAEFRVNLPSTVMFNYPTISGMTDLLVDECTNKKITWSR